VRRFRQCTPLLSSRPESERMRRHSGEIPRTTATEMQPQGIFPETVSHPHRAHLHIDHRITRFSDHPVTRFLRIPSCPLWLSFCCCAVSNFPITKLPNYSIPTMVDHPRGHQATSRTEGQESLCRPLTGLLNRARRLRFRELEKERSIFRRVSGSQNTMTIYGRQLAGVSRRSDPVLQKHRTGG
jgi:hypothetical protein